MRRWLAACVVVLTTATVWGGAAITDVEPNFGPATGGTTITLTGTGLSGTSKVYVGQYECTNVQVMSDVQVTAVTAGGAPGTYSVYAIVGGVYIFAPDTERFEYVAKPVISSLSPNPGWAGATLRILGQYFRSTAKVEFGPPVNQEVTPSYVTSTQIDVTIPSGALGTTVSLVVNNHDEGPTGQKSEPVQFTFTMPPALVTGLKNTGPDYNWDYFKGGKTITLVGENFYYVSASDRTKVYFFPKDEDQDGAPDGDGVPVTSITYTSSTELSVVVPEAPLTAVHGENVPIAVWNTYSGGGTYTPGFCYKDEPPWTCVITSPSNGTTVGGTVAVQAEATDDRGIVKIEFYDTTVSSTEPFATDTTWPFSITWDTTQATAGAHVWKARAYDVRGGYKDSSAITLTVSQTGYNLPPVVTIKAPANNATVSGSSVAVIAEASDPDGISRVRFYWLNEYGQRQTIGEDTTAGPPGIYTVIWNTLAVTDSTRTVRVIAEAHDGTNYATSGVTVTVNNSSNPPLTLGSITEHWDSVRGGKTVTVRGSRFSTTGTTTLTFWGVAATGVTVTNSTTLTAVVPRCPDNRQGGPAEVKLTTGGQTVTSSGLFWYVDSPPTCTWIGPPDGAIVTGTVALQAEATDDRAVTEVEFQYDAGSDNWTKLALVGNPDVKWPFSLDVDTSQAPFDSGSVKLRAVARDNRQPTPQEAISDEVTLTISSTGADNPPVVNMTAPPAGSRVAGTVRVAARATDDQTQTVDLSAEFTIATGDGYTVYQTLPGSYDAATGEFFASWVVTEPAGSYRVRVMVTDTAGNSAIDGVIVNIGGGGGGGGGGGCGAPEPGVQTQWVVFTAALAMLGLMAVRRVAASTRRD